MDYVTIDTSNQKFGKSEITPIVYPIDIISVDEAKEQLRVDLDDDDQYIELLINAAFNTINNYTNRQVLRCNIEYETYLNSVQSVLLPYESDNVIHVALDGDSGTNGSNYVVNNYEGADTYIMLDEYYSGIINVEFETGYDATNILPIYKEAAYLLIDHWYEVRELVGIRSPEQIPLMLDILLDTKRRMVI